MISIDTTIIYTCDRNECRLDVHYEGLHTSSLGRLITGFHIKEMNENDWLIGRVVKTLTYKTYIRTFSAVKYIQKHWYTFIMQISYGEF